MTERTKHRLIVAILVAVFFIAGFLTVGSLLDITLSQVVLGIVSGAIGGLTVAALIIWNTRAQAADSAVA